MTWTSTRPRLLCSSSNRLSFVALWLVLSALLAPTPGAAAAERSLSELTRSAEKECGAGGWMVPRNEFHEFENKRSPKRYCYRAGRIRRGTWVDAFLECRRNASELVWVSGTEEAQWLVDVLHAFGVDRTQANWFSPQNGWMVNAHRYLHSESYGEGARWKGGLFVRLPPNASAEARDAERVFIISGTVENTCENSAAPAAGSSSPSQPQASYLSPGDCFAVFNERLKSVGCKALIDEEFGYMCKKAYRDPAADDGVNMACFERCPAGWPQHSLDGGLSHHCYYVGAYSGTAITWYEALSQCRLLGMELWEPRAANETQYLNTFLSTGSREYPYWWVNAHSLLYAGSNASSTSPAASLTGLYWRNAQPMGTKSTGDGFSVPVGAKQSGDLCGAAHTFLDTADNLLANVSSCRCPQKFGYLCRAPICTPAERSKKLAFQQRLEERESSPFLVLLFVLLIISLLFNVLLVALVVVAVLWYKLCRHRRRRVDADPESNNEDETGGGNNPESLPLHTHPVLANDQHPEDHDVPDSAGGTLNSDHREPGPAERVLDPNAAVQSEPVGPGDGTMDSNQNDPPPPAPAEAQRPPPVQVNAQVLRDTPSPASSPPGSASDTLASRSSRLPPYNRAIAESDEEDEKQ